MPELIIDIWIIPSEKRILVTDFPGPPAAICGYVSEEAAVAARKRGHPTVSEIGFPTDLHLGPFDDWKTAREVADAKAKELGYAVEMEDSMFADPDEEGDEAYWDWGFEYPEDWDIEDWDE